MSLNNDNLNTPYVQLAGDNTLHSTSYVSAPEPGTCRRLLRCEKGICFRFASGIVCILSITIMVLGLLFYPQVPGYSLCNKQIQWFSILTTLINYEPNVNVELLASVYNPNRIDVNVRKMSLDIYYKDTKVGTAVSRNAMLRAGSISDAVVQANLNPSIPTAVQMLADYTGGNLYVNLKAYFDTSIAYWDRAILDYNAALDFDDINVNEEADRQYCKCVNDK